MAWEGSTRKQTLPSNWQTLRKHALHKAAHKCQWATIHGTPCNAPANQVDHIGDPNNHHPTNLQALCEWHHNKKSSKQGNTKRRRATNKHPKEQHPGLRTPTRKHRKH